MKRTRIVAGVLMLSIMALAFSTSIVNATTYLPYIINNARGNVWTVNTQPYFSGNLVDKSTIAAYYLPEGEENIEDYVELPTEALIQVVLTDKFIILVFDGSLLPAHADGAMVTGSYDGGDFLVFGGPGWVYRFH